MSMQMLMLMVTDPPTLDEQIEEIMDSFDFALVRFPHSYECGSIEANAGWLNRESPH